MFNLCLTSIPHRSVKAYELVRDSHAKKRQENFSRKPLLQNQQKLGKLSSLTRQGKMFPVLKPILIKRRLILRNRNFCPEKKPNKKKKKNMRRSLTLRLVCVTLHFFPALYKLTCKAKRRRFLEY